MPGMSGYEVLEQLRADSADARHPGDLHHRDERRPRTSSAAWCSVRSTTSTKPLQPGHRAGARAHASGAEARARPAAATTTPSLEAEIARRMRENQVIQDVTIRALARLAETRDNETGNHILRTQEYVRDAGAARCASIRASPPRSTSTRIALIAKSAPLHDIGKVGIPDHVLLKPGKLTPDEWEVMKTHARLGAEAIERAVADTRAAGASSSPMRQADRAAPPRALGRQRLPRRPGRRRHPAGGPPDGAGRRVRRADLAPRLQGADAAGRGRARIMAGAARPALRSRPARRLPRRLRRVLRASPRRYPDERRAGTACGAAAGRRAPELPAHDANRPHPASPGDTAGSAARCASRCVYALFGVAVDLRLGLAARPAGDRPAMAGAHRRVQGLGSSSA